MTPFINLYKLSGSDLDWIMRVTGTKLFIKISLFAREESCPFFCTMMYAQIAVHRYIWSPTHKSIATAEFNSLQFTL